VTSYSPGEAASKTGFSLDTLRYYERIGLLPPVDRTAGGWRRYSDTDLLWLMTLRCLRDTGMSVRQMRDFIDLAAHLPLQDRSGHRLIGACLHTGMAVPAAGVVCLLPVAGAGQAARLGGWPRMTWVPSGLVAAKVPSAKGSIFQPHLWMAMSWWNWHPRKQPSTLVGPPSFLCRMW
jgi:DNA-binding transcriptional MerR regulator